MTFSPLNYAILFIYLGAMLAIGWLVAGFLIKGTPADPALTIWGREKLRDVQ